MCATLHVPVMPSQAYATAGTETVLHLSEQLLKGLMLALRESLAFLLSFYISVFIDALCTINLHAIFM